jgi:hypothetical protein
MSADDSPVGGDEPQDLQFDRVETASLADTTASPAVTCAVCGKSVDREYYHANGKTICDSCRQVVTAAAATPRSIATLVTAGVFGLGAAIAGAAIYYAVITIANLEIGIVAILIGYMVGWAVRKGARGGGGRRFQILAVVLTYWAVGLAYTPLAFQEMPKYRGLFLFSFALPLLSVFGSMPMGLISALIIFIGLRQAWRMTGRPELVISGPYKVGTGPAPAAG